MKGLLLLVLCCMTKLALSKTVNYTIEKECNKNYVRSSQSALAFSGKYSTEYGDTCEVAFQLMKNQRDFTFRIEHLYVNSKDGVLITIKQFSSGVLHSSKKLWEMQFRNTSGFSVKLNSTDAYEQKVYIRVLADHYDHDDVSVNVQLVVTPSYLDEFCHSAASKPTYYLCSATHECVHNELLCDGYNNCEAREDEMSCHGLSSSSTKPNNSAPFTHGVSTTRKPNYSSAGHSHKSTVYPYLNETVSSASNGTVTYVIWWWHSWYITSLLVIGGILLVVLFLTIFVCCIQACLSSCKKNKVRTSPTSSSINATHRTSRCTPVPEVMQVSVIQSKAYAELPPAYNAVVESPPDYSHVTVFLDSPCGNSSAVI